MMEHVEIEDITEEIYWMIDEYLEMYLSEYSDSDFKDIMLEELVKYFYMESILEGWEMKNIEDVIWCCMEETFLYYQIPEREMNCSIVYPFIGDIDFGEQIPQRTTEWYQFRHNRFSASSIWKILDSAANFNSLIYEKCKPFDMFSGASITNDYNPRNWGVKYEPLSVMVYKHKHPKTILKTDYGCIPHPLYPFIGASPDGINISLEYPEKYGCMLEIKNIFNREITGIPSKEYWIQTQIQMETCNLEQCDFLETRFKEYALESDFYEDGISEYKGVILFLLGKNGFENKFEYMPLYISLEQNNIEQWIEDIKQKYENTHIVYDRTYWYLDEYSCVNIRRNIPWFESILHKLRDAWQIVEKERMDGYQHRAPKKKDNQPVNKIVVNKLGSE
jgi:hypothetical protein